MQTINDLMVQSVEAAPAAGCGRSQKLPWTAGARAFGRFKRVLAGCPKEHSRRFDFKLAAMSGWIRERLNDLDIEPGQRSFKT